MLSDGTHKGGDGQADQITRGEGSTEPDGKAVQYRWPGPRMETAASDHRKWMKTRRLPMLQLEGFYA
jgi:hypothetical protein